MPVISLPTNAMGPFGMPMTPGNGSSGGEGGGGGTTFGGKSISQNGSTWVYDGPDADSAVDVFTGITWVNSGYSFVASIQTAGTNNQYGIYQFNTTTPYSTQPSDISFNASFLTYNEIADADFSPKSIIFNNDGSKGFFIEDNELFGFDMSTNYDISTATGTGHTKTSLPNLYGPNDVRFNNNGTKMFVSDVTFGTPIVIEYALSSAYDVTTRSQTASFDPSQAANGGTSIFGIQFNIDGTKMYALGNGGAGGQRYLYEYNLSTAFDLTTISYANERIDLETLAGIDLAESFTFNDDFSKLYIADGNDGVLQFDWGTASTPTNPTMPAEAFTNSISSANGGGHTYALASTSLTTDFGDQKKLDTNGTYTIVSDPNLNINHTGTGTVGTATEVQSAGWVWIVRNSDGAVMKSWNGILNGDHGDSNLQQETLGSNTSIGISANFGYSVAINDNYAFTVAVYRPSGGHTTNNFSNNRAYVFAYKLSDFTLAKVWKVNDFYTQIDAYVGAPSYSSFGSGFGEHGIEVTNDSMYIPSGYTAHTSNSNYPGGAVSYFDISDATPSNWGNPTVFKNPLGVNTTTNIDGSNYSNGNFGSSGVYAYDTKVIVTHATRAHNYNRSGTTFTEANSYTPNYYIGQPYNAVLSSGKVAMVAGATLKTLTLRDPSNGWSQDWQVTVPGNGFPGINVFVDNDTIDGDKILVGDGFNDGAATDDGIITVYNTDGTVHSTVNNPTPTNTRFGYSFAVKKGKLVASIRVGGSSTAMALQFMTLSYGGPEYGLTNVSYSGGTPNTISNLAGGNFAPYDLSWKKDGSGLFMADNSGYMRQYDMTADFDLTSGSYAGSSTDVTLIDNPENAEWIDTNGQRLGQYLGTGSGSNDDLIYRTYYCNTPYDWSTYLGYFYGEYRINSTTLALQMRHTISDSIRADIPYGATRVKFSDDGKHMIFFRNSGMVVVTASTSSPFDTGLSSSSWIGGATLSSLVTENPTSDNLDIIFNNRGTKIWVAHNGTDKKVYEFTCSTPWDPSTATHTTTLDLSSYAGNLYSLALNDTQNKLYTGGLGIPGATSDTFVSSWNLIDEASGGGGGGGGGQSQPQGWIATISDELNGNGYTDVQLRSLAVDSSDNIYAGGDATYYQLVVKMASDGTVTSAASFGASATTNNHRAITVASDESVYTAGEAKDMWGQKDGHVMRLTTALTKSYDDFFGEGYNDEHFDITSDNSGNIFAVGESQSFALNFSGDPKGHLVKYNNTGGQAKTLITDSQSRSYPQGISSDGTNVYVIAKDSSHMFIAKVNNALNSVTWSKSWGSSSAEPRIMDIDTNSSGESAALMYQGNKIRVAKIDSSGNDTWRKTWEKASTDHGDAYPGYDFSAGYAVKLLSNGSIAMLAGYMPWTTQANKKSVYIIIFDSTGTPTVEKEFRLNNASHYLGQVTKSLVELSDGKIVTAVPYYTGSAWKNGIFKFDPTDTSTAINGTHGDWDISDISDSTTGADGTAYSNGSVFLDTNMSMYFKTGYQGGTNGFPVSSATVVEDTKQTLGGGGGSSGASPDMSTLSYSNKSVDVGPNTGSEPKAIWFESDGLTLYVSNNNTNTVYKYTLSTAWDISTATYASSNYNMATYTTSINDVAWRSDASSYYALGNDQGGTTPDKIYQFDIPSGLTLAHTTHTKTGTIANAANNSVDSTPQKLMFNADGSQVYVSGDATDTIYKFNLTTPWDISTIQQWNGSDSFQTSETTNPRGMTFNHDGTKLYRIDGEGTSPVAIDVYTLSTAYDITSVTTTTDTYAINGPGIIRPEGIYVKEDGTGLYIVDGHSTFATSKIYQFDTTPLS